MSAESTGLWPWLALAGLGAYHGLNPAMGWLFAVALGLFRRSRTAVLLALAPIALGHAAAVSAVVLAFLAFRTVLDPTLLRRFAGLFLIGWAVWHALGSHSRPVRIGMQTGLAGLALWSFAMASTHGAGLMLIPVFMPLCAPASSAGVELTAAESVPLALAAIGVHSAAMLATIGAAALVVYEWVGLAFLRRGWINVDALWTAALGVSGVVLLAS